jgi:UDP:flavonoid glycosyltransferase YjiC (YdhE family)
LIAIGSRLQEAGHEVVLSAQSLFKKLITDSGLRMVAHDFGGDGPAVEGKPDFGELESPAKAVMEFVSPKGMRRTGEQLLAALKDEPADILLLSPYAELAGHPLAEARSIPSIGIRLQPMSTTAEFPPSLLGAWNAGPVINRVAGKFSAAAIDRFYGKTIAELRAQLGLPRLSAKRLRRRRTNAEWPILHGFSPAVVPRPRDWRPGLDIVGYWWPPRPIGWEPPENLVRFLESGPPPMYIGFGSLPLPKAEAARVSNLVAQALRQAKVRGIVQGGWANLDVNSDDILTIDEVPHDWLFDHVGAVAHACGAGTTAAGMRAGVPAIGIPYAGDQAFWARRLDMHGVSAGTIPFKKLTADSLAAAITKTMTDNTLRANAKVLAAKLADEDGAGEVVKVVERLTAGR